MKDTEKKLGKSPSKENEDAWNVARTELEEEYDIITQGIIVRSRANWVENGEK